MKNAIMKLKGCDKIAGEWLEELVSELYTIKGYFCLKNIPGPAKETGGRDEMDLIALKFRNGQLVRIKWIEVSEYLSNGKGAIIGKYTPEKEIYLKNYLKEIYGIEIYADMKVENVFYCAYEHPKIQKLALPAVLKCRKELMEECGKAIQKFRSRYRKISGAKSASTLTIPNHFSSLKMYEKLVMGYKV